MRYLKVYESYFQDLTTYTYGDTSKSFRIKYPNFKGDECLNIGWIGSEIPVIGNVSDEFIKKLEEVEKSNEFTSERHMGYHRCQICGEILGSSVKKINGERCYELHIS